MQGAVSALRGGQERAVALSVRAESRALSLLIALKSVVAAAMWYLGLSVYQCPVLRYMEEAHGARVCPGLALRTDLRCSRRERAEQGDPGRTLESRRFPFSGSGQLLPWARCQHPENSTSRLPRAQCR